MLRSRNGVEVPAGKHLTPVDVDKADLLVEQLAARGKKEDRDFFLVRPGRAGGPPLAPIERR